MGFKVLLIAVKGKTPETVQAEYGVTPVEEYEEIPEAPVSGTVLPDGAYLLYVNDEILPDGHLFARLSRDAELLSCYVYENVGDSHASRWVNGSEVWSVSHSASAGRTDLSVNGDPPPDLGPIRDRLMAEQAQSEDVDWIFQTPGELFAAVGGIRYDDDLSELGPTPWQVLSRPPRQSPPRRWWWPF